MIQPLVMYFNNWQYLDTFAAAHARLGNFDLAIVMQERAVADAQSQVPELTDTIAQMQERLEMFQGNQAYEE